MSRSGYSEDIDDWLVHGRWRGRVASATRGARGQAMLRALLAALDAMPVKELIADSFKQPETGQFCTLGVLLAERGMNPGAFEAPYDDDGVNADWLAASLNVAAPLVKEIMYENDEDQRETPAERWQRMRSWIASQIRDEVTS